MAILSKPFKPCTQRTQVLVLLASLLLLRSSIISLPGYLISKLRYAARGKRLTTEELLQTLQQVYVKEKDGSKTLLVPYKDAYVSRVSSPYEITANLILREHRSLFVPYQKNNIKQIDRILNLSQEQPRQNLTSTRPS